METDQTVQTDPGAEVGDESPMKEAVAFEAETNAAVKALDALSAALAAGLSSRLEQLNAPLEQEAEVKAAEARTLRASHGQLQPRVAAQQRILALEIDQAIAAGRDDEAEAKRRESASLTANLEKILADAKACEGRVQELQIEQSGNLGQVPREMFPLIRESCVSVEIALAKLLDTVADELLGHGVPGRFLTDLTPDEKGWEKVWFERLRSWFGGRRV